MLRIDEKLLSLNDGDNKFYLDGKVYSGIGFKCSDRYVMHAYVYEDGVKIKTYNSYLKYHSNGCIYLRDSLEEDYADYSSEPILLEGEKFTGLAYEMENGYCIGEVFVRDGIIVEEAFFYKNGELEEYALFEEENALTQSFSFEENGIMSAFTVKLSSDFYWNCQFDCNDATIKTFRMNGYFAEVMPLLQKNLKFINILDVDELIMIGCYSRFIIGGSGIDINLFNKFILLDCFNKVNRITISKVNLNKTEMKAILSKLNIHEICFTGSDEFFDVFYNYKKENKNIHVEFNQKEICAN